MYPTKRTLGSLILAASLLTSAASLGCADRVRVYDEFHADWQSWDRDEDRAYHRYWDDRHESYRDYKSLNKDQQKDYWNWRHQHSDSDRH